MFAGGYLKTARRFWVPARTLANPIARYVLEYPFVLQAERRHPGRTRREAAGARGVGVPSPRLLHHVQCDGSAQHGGAQLPGCAARPWPVQPPLFAARHRPIVGDAIAAPRALRSGLMATAGGNGGSNPPLTRFSQGRLASAQPLAPARAPTAATASPPTPAQSAPPQRLAALRRNQGAAKRARPTAMPSARCCRCAAPTAASPTSRPWLLAARLFGGRADTRVPGKHTPGHPCSVQSVCFGSHGHASEHAHARARTQARGRGRWAGIERSSIVRDTRSERPLAPTCHTVQGGHEREWLADDALAARLQ